VNKDNSLERVAELMKDFGTAEKALRGRMVIRTTPEKVRDAVRACTERLHCDRLITISAADEATGIELIYHFTGPHRNVISISVMVPRDNVLLPTLSDLLPPAGILERQIHDLFGVEFTGHPGLKKLMLNEDWPENEFPLRKDWKQGVDTFYGGTRTEAE